MSNAALATALIKELFVGPHEFRGGSGLIASRLRAVLEEVARTAPCGCTGFLHDCGCSDQNVIDPLGAILDGDHRDAVRTLLVRHFGGQMGHTRPVMREGRLVHERCCDGICDGACVR